MDAEAGKRDPVTIGRDTETGQWQMILRPTSTSLILWHAPTPGELARKLSADLS
jgi:hypothetical protein